MMKQELFDKVKETIKKIDPDGCPYEEGSEEQKEHCAKYSCEDCQTLFLWDIIKPYLKRGLE